MIPTLFTTIPATSPEKHIPLAKLLEPEVPASVVVSITNRPLLTRTLKSPVAIAVRYTNLNDPERTELATSFLVHIVDNHTPEKLSFPQFHDESGHSAVCVYSWTEMGKYAEFKEDVLGDLPQDTVWVEE